MPAHITLLCGGYDESGTDSVNDTNNANRAVVEFYTTENARNAVAIFSGVRLFGRPLRLVVQRQREEFAFYVFVRPLTTSVLEFAAQFGRFIYGERHMAFASRDAAQRFISAVHNRRVDGDDIRAEWYRH